MENKKILMISTTDNMIWQFLLPHIKHLQTLGNTVECVCAKTGFWFDELQNKFGLVVHNIPFERSPLKLQNIRAYKMLKKLQEEKKYDLVYCQQPVGGVMGRIISKKYKIPCIYTAHGFHFFKGNSKIKNFIFRTIEKHYSRYTDALITINEEDYQSALKMHAKHVYKINGIGIDLDKFKLEKFDRDLFKKELGLNEKDKIILTVSELNKNKNYITMLKTIKQLVEKDNNIKFVSCGCGVWEEKIKTYAKTLNIDSNCIFLGYRTDIKKIMSISDIFFHASYREGLTLSVMEAMNMGLPCAVSNVRGNKDLIQDNVNGFVCEPEDYIEFAKKIETLIENKDMYNKMSKQNKIDSKQYCIDNVKEQLLKIYKEYL